MCPVQLVKFGSTLFLFVKLWDVGKAKKRTKLHLTKRMILRKKSTYIMKLLKTYLSRHQLLLNHQKKDMVIRFSFSIRSQLLFCQNSAHSHFWRICFFSERKKLNAPSRGIQVINIIGKVSCFSVRIWLVILKKSQSSAFSDQKI